jgi:hypothetical protein
VGTVTMKQLQARRSSRLGAKAQVRGGFEFFRLGLQREVVPGLQLGDALLR